MDNNNKNPFSSGAAPASRHNDGNNTAQQGPYRPNQPSQNSRPAGQPATRPVGQFANRQPQSRPNGTRPNFSQNDRNASQAGRSEKQDLHAINENIHAKEVRLVGDNVEQGIYTIQEARRIAEELELDLIEISPTAQPPVCKILDYQKYLYQQKKRQKEQKAKAAKVTVKEIRFGPQTDDHDFNFKLKHAQGFLQEGSKVKAYVFFKGRSILFKEQGEVLLLKFANALEDYGKVEQMPVLEGKRMILMISPKKK